MEGDFEGDFENSVGERDLRYVNRFHARGGGFFAAWRGIEVSWVDMSGLFIT